MTTTISYPADAVTKGATEIQATTFALVAADYVRVDLSAVQQFIANNGSLESLPNPQNKGANGLPAWQFFRRKDMSGANSAFANLIGLKTVISGRNVAAWDVTNTRGAAVPVQVRRIEGYNWYPILMTLDSGVVAPIWTVDYDSYTVVLDPMGTVLYGDGSHRVGTELRGFMLTYAAASQPTNERALAAMFGNNAI